MKVFKHDIQSNEHQYRFLETDGNGGFISQTVTGANIRNDDSLYTISLKHPVKRYKLVQKFDELIIVNGKKYNLSSQTYVNEKRNTSSKHNVLEFANEYYPIITFAVEEIIIEKELIFLNLTNQVAVKYTVHNPLAKEIQFEVTPQIAGYNLGQGKSENLYDYKVNILDDVVSFVSKTSEDVFIKSNCQFAIEKQNVITDYYYPHDTRDGRDGIGSSSSYGKYGYKSNEQCLKLEFILSDKYYFNYNGDALFESEVERKKAIIESSNGNSQFANRLALATDNYLVNRDSTKGKTIIAGYPFFGDWGRDTFWAFNGVCLQTNRFEEAKDILKSFLQYEKNGLIPNMFPEGDEYPFYNTADAPLLFINSVYEYVRESNDSEFIVEVKSTIESVINNYISGTDYHIYMDEDYLISSGANLEQLTWMDVRFDKILPTPRQGKCVEINAMWYNSLKIISHFEHKYEIKFNLSINVEELADNVLASFKSKFIKTDGSLKDVITADGIEDDQIRSNMLWAVTQEFSPLSTAKMKAVVKVASSHLYTPLGIRTLSLEDNSFKSIYGGSHYQRDMAYHQGTVWPFIYGSYIRAYLKSEEYSKESKRHARKLLIGLENNLNEYCIGQISEVFDGLNPSYSKGCYAQAWSIAEVYQALNEVEE